MSNDKIILMAHPVGGNIPAWWPKDPAGDPDWVTVRADGQGWTSGEDDVHAIVPKLVEENIEIFMFGYLAEDEDDEDDDEDDEDDSEALEGFGDGDEDDEDDEDDLVAIEDVFDVEFEFAQVKVDARR